MSKMFPQLADFNNTHVALIPGQSQILPGCRAYWRSLQPNLCLQFQVHPVRLDEINKLYGAGFFWTGDDMAVGNRSVRHFQKQARRRMGIGRFWLGGTTVKRRSGDNGDLGQ
ncbi:hypothetical protein [Duncaniella freteri]|uniref:hypothetical protein n=1 Tax=Duncaniella freteri TaxID=2530391 RepID=UPI003F674FD4